MKTWLAFLALAGWSLAARADATNAVVRLQGRVAPAGTNLVFKADSGARYRLARSPAAEALFLDTNLLSRELLLTGKVNGRDFEITGNLRSVKKGRVYELYYYCDICSISSSVPGLCQCCREPSVLTEKLEK